MNKSQEQVSAEEKGQVAFRALLQGNYKYAADMFSLALKELRGQANEEIYYVLCLDGLGQAQLGHQLFAEAEASLGEALSLYENVFVDDSFGRFSVLCHLGLVNSRQGLYERARTFYGQALIIGEATLQSEPLVLVHACLEGYAYVLRKLNLDVDAKLMEARIEGILKAADSDGT